MAKLKADQYRIRVFNDRKAIIEFKGENARTFEVEMPTHTLMGLAHAVRDTCHQVLVGLASRMTSGLLALRGPQIPPELGEWKEGSQGSSFGVGISPDFEVIFAFFKIPNEGETDGVEFAAGLPLEDAEKLHADLGKAIELSRSRPDPSRGPTTTH